jgi:DNA (cytosine-5)-methyltransferase 1
LPIDAFARRPAFIDIFAGCGGISLGLMQAGWRGLFALERDRFAFETLAANLAQEDSKFKFRWPTWLPCEPLSVEDCLQSHGQRLDELRGHVDMLVGGPPCQGFSMAGRRNLNDPRNQLMSTYLEFVSAIEPKIVLIENVRGFTIDFAHEHTRDGRMNYAQRLQSELSGEYVAFAKMLDLACFGIPQQRKRFFVIGFRRSRFPGTIADPFLAIEAERTAFLRQKGLSSRVSSRAAISDLEVGRNGTTPSAEYRDFLEIRYGEPKTTYQKLMRMGATSAATDCRLARHSPHVAARFEKLISLCHAQGRLNVALDEQTRESFGLKKRAVRVLDPDRPAPTVTSMPDDLLHYSEPRTLTVRENARLQSFPDWFSFRGKYTTGGHLRRREVPRFTQVANAVPPLVAEAIGHTLLGLAVGSGVSASAR